MKIIVAIDGGARQHDALALAGRVARVTDAELVVAHVYAWPSVAARIGGAYEVTVRQDADELLAAASSTIEVPHTTRAIGATSVARGLHELCVTEHADLVVVGSSHRSAFGRAAFGTVGERLLHGAPCPVALAPHGFADDARDPVRIGVAFDGTDESRAALAWGSMLAERAGGDVTVLSVVEPVPAGLTVPPAPAADLTAQLRASRRSELEEAVDALPADLHPRGELLEGPVAHRLAEHAGALDLLVCGSRGYGPVGAVLLGSVSRGLFHEAPCPVIAVPRGVPEDRSAPDAGRREISV